MWGFVCAATAATQDLHVKLSENVVAFIYLGMAEEDFKFTICITWIMAKEATIPKPSMQRE